MILIRPQLLGLRAELLAAEFSEETSSRRRASSDVASAA
jgi:hypothetical protein